MSLGRIAKSLGWTYAAIPYRLLERCPLSMGGRAALVAAVAVSEMQEPPSLELLAVLMGLKPTNKKSCIRYLRELVDAGFLEIESGRDHWENNSYTLVIPDYCHLDDLELVRMALQSPRTVNIAQWRAGQGKTARRPRKALFDRVAWIKARQEARAAKRREAIERGQIQTLAKRKTEGTPGPSVEGTPGLSLDGTAGPSPVQLLINSGKGRRDSPPSGFAPREPRPQIMSGPAFGWEEWVGLYAQATGGRLFMWNKKQREIADEISGMVSPHSNDPAYLSKVQKKFLGDTFWAATGEREHKTPWPLEALRKNLSDFLPAVEQLLPSMECEHPKESRRVERIETEEKIVKKETCLICKKMIGEKVVKIFSLSEKIEKRRETLEAIRATGDPAATRSKFYRESESEIARMEAQLKQEREAS